MNIESKYPSRADLTAYVQNRNNMSVARRLWMAARRLAGADKKYVICIFVPRTPAH